MGIQTPIKPQTSAKERLVIIVICLSILVLLMYGLWAGIVAAVVLTAAAVGLWKAGNKYRPTQDDNQQGRYNN